MKVDGVWRRAIEPRGDGVTVLDQARLPYRTAWLPLRTLDEVARAIRDMHVRGAPLIGATAAYGVAIALRADRSEVALDRACAELAATRPTAVNLAWALAEMRRRLAGVAPSVRTDAAFAAAGAIADADVATCEAIGKHGRALLAPARDRVDVLTHCNAGWLATVDWGTALAPIYRAHDDGVPVHVWVDETRPRNQGLLTAWELAQHGVPHTVIADNAGGHLMQRGVIDLVIVGTDRTTRRGDVCNKIGTYLKALAARDCDVPFYVAAPAASIDWAIDDAEDIPIEERDGDEVRVVRGAGGAVTITDAPVANPAFDVTPARLVTAIITERGVVAPGELAALYGR
jgi:methylthioribose-1-phosphate isomerase